MLIAKNKEGSTLKIIKHVTVNGTFYRFSLCYNNEGFSFITGNPYESKKLILDDARNFALSPLCGCFKPSDLVEGLPEVKSEFTQDQIASLNIAYNKLQDGSEQEQIAAFYIKQMLGK